MLYEEFSANVPNISYEQYKDTYEIVYANKDGFIDKRNFYKYAKKQGYDRIYYEAQEILQKEVLLAHLYEDAFRTHNFRYVNIYISELERQGYRLNVDHIKWKAEKKIAEEQRKHTEFFASYASMAFSE